MCFSSFPAFGKLATGWKSRDGSSATNTKEPLLKLERSIIPSEQITANAFLDKCITKPRTPWLGKSPKPRGMVGETVAPIHPLCVKCKI